MHTIATTLLVGSDSMNPPIRFNVLFESTIWMVNDMLRRPANCAFPWLDKIPTPTNRTSRVVVFTPEYFSTLDTTNNSTLWAHQDTLCGVITTLIRKKKDEIKKGLKKDDVVSMLLQDESLTEKDLIGILAIFFFAGFDTTANSMTMVLYNLARNPDVQRRAREDAFDTSKKKGRKPPQNHIHRRIM